MRILWITNNLFPEIQESLGKKNQVSSGGWMRALASSIITNIPDIDLGIASVYSSNEPYIEKKIGDITFFCLPYKENKLCDLANYWKKVKTDFSPDVVHIHGTEQPYGLAYIRANGPDHVVLSLQGIISVIARYSLGYLSVWDILRNITIHDILDDHLLLLPRKLRKKGIYEHEYLKRAKYVIGRTSWDRTHVWAINKNIQYFVCNEMLRSEFYESPKWSYEQCRKHSIFLSQARTPFKGLHMLLKAMPLILEQYPDTMVYIAGEDYTKTKTIRDKLRQRTYAKYCTSIIKKYNMDEHFCFLNTLDAGQMVSQYLLTNVFLSPSSIENSPNSVAEAQILGTPVVASYVGGTPDMVRHESTGLLYRFEEPELLAYSICRVFGDTHIESWLSKQEIEVATVRHNEEAILDSLMSIYINVAK